MSFRGKIAIPIETEIRLILRENISFSADIVECGGFISSLLFILFIKLGITDEVNTFQKKYKDYIGLTYNEISITKAEAIYKECMKILKQE